MRRCQSKTEKNISIDEGFFKIAIDWLNDNIIFCHTKGCTIHQVKESYSATTKICDDLLVLPPSSCVEDGWMP